MCKINRILKALSCSAPVTVGGVDLCPCVNRRGVHSCQLKCVKEKGPVVICRWCCCCFFGCWISGSERVLFWVGHKMTSGWYWLYYYYYIE